MQYIGKSKISKLRSKPTIVYPQLHLPKRYFDLIGQTAHFFEIEDIDGAHAFFTITDQTGRERAQPKNLVLKLASEVSKLNCQKDVEERLLELESQINELKSLLLLNESFSLHNNKKEDEHEWARPDSNRRPPPCQGDVIT